MCESSAIIRDLIVIVSWRCYVPYRLYPLRNLASNILLFPRVATESIVSRPRTALLANVLEWARIPRISYGLPILCQKSAVTVGGCHQH